MGKAYHGSFGNTPEIANAYIRARKLSQEIGNTSTLCLALSGLSIYYYVKAEHLKALELAEIMLSLSLEHADPLLISIGHWNIGIALFALGDYERAREHYGHVLAGYNPKNHHQELVSSRGVDVGLSAMAYDACCLWIFWVSR